MNGETPSVPITTLAGVASLTDLLPQLPLPTPLPQTVQNKSLLYSHKIAEDARQLLASSDEGLGNQLAHALRQTNSSQIELKDTLSTNSVEGYIPSLLQTVMRKDPHIFQGNAHLDGTFFISPIQTLGNNFQQHGVMGYNNSSGIHPHAQQFSSFLQEGQRISSAPVHGSSHNNQLSGSPRHGHAQSPRYPPNVYASPSNSPYLAASAGMGHQSNSGISTSYQPNAVASPAQATAAERVLQHPFTNQASPVLSQNSTDPLSRHNRRTRNPPSIDLQYPHGLKPQEPVQKLMDVLPNRTNVHSVPVLPEPVIVLNDIGDQINTNISRLPLPPHLASPSVKNADPPYQKSKMETKKKNEPVVMLEMLDPSTLKTIQKGGSVKTDCDSDSRKRKREETNYNISRAAGPGDMSFQASRNRRSDDTYKNRAAKRRRNSVESDDASSLSEFVELEEDEEAYNARMKKKEKQNKKRLLQPVVSLEDLMDSHIFKKFNSCTDLVFDCAEDANFASLDKESDDVECPPESLISRNVLTDLCGEAAKLKAMNALSQVPPERLVKLLTILLWNVRDGCKVTPNINQEEDEEESKLWRELTMDRVMRSMDASLTALAIMTGRNMPKQVYLEDVIERIILYAKFQLHNTIYPEFDPVYKIDPKAKDGYHGSLKAKRARAGSVKHKSTITLYNKMCELVNALASLLEIQQLTDTVILQVSSLGVSTFFVENISELQLNSMKLVTTVFSRYSKHRQLILEDIFASLARLPSSKRNLRNYRLNSDESIQMVTALALQLIQCVVRLPDTNSEEEGGDQEKNKKNKSPEEGAISKSDNDVLIVTSYETAMRTGYNFLSVFLKKCTTKGEEDYRPLFENFVQDLLTTVNKPEWPASELLLSLLGRILVQQFSSKSTDMSLRVASLEYLGIVAARLRKDAVTSQLNQDVIADIVHKVSEGDDDDPAATKSKKNEQKGVTDVTERLQQAMLEYLAYNAQSESALFFAREFYIAQWFRDTTVEAEKTLKAHLNTSGEEQDEDFNETKEETSTEVMQNAEKRKAFLSSQISCYNKPLTNLKHAGSKLDYDSACLVARYLSSKRPFAQSFDIYLTQILKVLSETAVAVRTKAMKCLTAVVEADPGILARTDMQRGVHGRFLDQSTSVREAAIELVGKFILIQPDLIPNYYDMLSDRILDTGISVRKRVIRIFKDICVEHSDFPKIPEMCVKMIRRVNDEEGIKKLVNEVFQTMWFTPLGSRDKDTEKLVQKVVNITDVVAAAKDTSYEFFEQLLENLLKKDDDGNYNKAAITACKQIVDCLVENVLRIEEKSVEKSEGRTVSSRLVGCLSTLHLFSKIKPDLMVEHATTLQPYLDIKCNTQGDVMVLHYVARILELVIPLMDHPSESFLAQVEEDLVKLILKHGMMVVQSCVSCLGAVVNDVSHNYELVRDCFKKFYGVLAKLMYDNKVNKDCPTLKTRRPTLLRALFTVGLLCKHFDFDSKDMGETKVCVRETVFDVFTYFVSHDDEDVQLKALTAIGFFACRHYTFMLGPILKDLYTRLLTDDKASVKLRCQVLRNLQVYLTEEELQMSKSDAEWKKHSKKEDLKEMGDVQSGMASTVMQVYLKELMEAFFHENSQVRLTALNVVTLVLKQGLVHPVQCIPYLISMGSDIEQPIRVKADQQLQEIEKKYPGFTHMKALQGMKASYRLQKVFHSNNPIEPVRGRRFNEENQPQALNAFLYSLLRSNRSHRRGLLTSIINLFDDSARISLEEQVFIADNLAYFAYQSQDEPLFIIHQTDIIVSVTGSNLLQSFRENLPHKHRKGEQNGMDGENLPNGDANAMEEDDDDDNPESLLQKLPEQIKPLEDIMRLSQGCVLLLVLKQHLKEMYGLTEGKIHRYSPSEAAKVYEKPLNRKTLPNFEPQHTLKVLRSVYEEDKQTEEEKRQKLVEDYLEFRDLMMSIDPAEDEESGDEARNAGHATSVPGFTKSPSHQSDPGDSGGRNGEPKTMDGDAEIDRLQANSTSGISENPSSASRSPKISHFPYDHHNQHHHHSDKKKRSQHSSHRTHKLLASGGHKTPTVKKKRKKKKRQGSDDDDDSDDDPDFIG